MDRSNLESARRLHHRVARLQQLLRDADGGPAASHGHGKICWDDAQVRPTPRLDGQGQYRLACIIGAAHLEEAAAHLRELHVGPISREGEGEIRSTGLASDGTCALAFLPDPDKTP